MDVRLVSLLRHIMFLGYQRICKSFCHKEFTHQKDTRVPSFPIVMMSMIVTRNLISSRTSHVDRRNNMWRGFTSIMTQRTTFQFMEILSMTINIRRSRNCKDLYMLIMRINKTLILHIKSYYNGTLDRDILCFNM